MNQDALLALADHLDSINPRDYDQDSWCGTAACVAGHAVAKLGSPEEQAKFRAAEKEYLGATKEDRYARWSATVLEEHLGAPIEVVAAGILGLEEEESDILFACGEQWPERYRDPDFDEPTAKTAAQRLRDLVNGEHELAVDRWGYQLD